MNARGSRLVWLLPCFVALAGGPSATAADEHQRRTQDEERRPPAADERRAPAPAAAPPAGKPARVDFGLEPEVEFIGSRARMSSVGFIMRPEFCLNPKHLCANGTFTVGFEVRYGWAGFAIRGGTGNHKKNQTGSVVALDLRVAWDFQLTHRLWLTPFFDLTCGINYPEAEAFGYAGRPQERLAIRGGIRLSYDIFPTLTVFLEPAAADWAFLVGKGGMDVSYVLGLGVLTRF